MSQAKHFVKSTLHCPWGKRSALLVLAAVVAGCASAPGRAPVEDRAVAQRPAVPAPANANADAASKPGTPSTDNAGKTGYYTVKPGDALIRIGLEFGQNWRDIARWNGIENPNLIEVGQVLRVIAPAAETAGAPAPPVAPAAAVAQTTPVTAGGSGVARPAPTAATGPTGGSAASAAVSAAPASAGTVPGAVPGAVAGAAASAAAAVPAAAPMPREPDDDVPWLWPASGPVATPFEEGRNKGLAITGKAGDPVFAAADGRVVYAGSGLRGYGNLIIVKHNATYLTAYAHNQSLLVKEDQVVRRGQRIAEMGSSDAERVQLHFEIRRLGKPIDPARLLPTR